VIRAFRDDDLAAVARIWRELRRTATALVRGVAPGPLRGADLTQEGSFAVAHRRRGLATLAKLAQLRWAAANGIDRVVTDSDERNAPMLAINRRLGYEPFTERRGYLKELTARAETACAQARAAPARSPRPAS
jgi:hypothetical protein